MRKTHRKVIAINAETGERVVFSGTYEAAKVLGSTPSSVGISLAMVTAVKGWRVYDTPDRILERIAELEEQIKMLKN